MKIMKVPNQLALNWRKADGRPIAWARDAIEGTSKISGRRLEDIWIRRKGVLVEAAVKRSSDSVVLSRPLASDTSDVHTHTCPRLLDERAGYSFMSFRDFKDWMAAVADGQSNIRYRHVASLDLRGNMTGYVSYLGGRNFFEIALSEGHTYARRKFEEMGEPRDDIFTNALVVGGLLHRTIYPMPGYRFDQTLGYFIKSR